jgi:hypothetical protein
MRELQGKVGGADDELECHWTGENPTLKYNLIAAVFKMTSLLLDLGIRR